MLNIYLDFIFQVIKKADNSRYENGNDIRISNLGLINLFGFFKITTSSGKHLEDTSHAHFVSSMYKLKTSAKNTDDLSAGLDRDPGRRKDELALNKNIKCKYHPKVTLKNVFGLAEHHEKATYGLGFELTLTKNKDDAVLDKAVGIADARGKIDHINWYVPQNTPSIQLQGF